MAHEHASGSCPLSGCGEGGTLVHAGRELATHAVERAGGRRVARLDGVSGDAVEEALTALGRERRAALRATGLLGAMVAAGPLLSVSGCASRSAVGPPATPSGGGGRVHTVESRPETVRLGVFDSTLPDVLEIEPGDTVLYPDTWTHFLNRMQPGVSIEQLAQWRRENPGKGPHSIIGPVGVRGAEPGDVLEIRYLRLRPKSWAANFNNPGPLGTGALPDVFAEGQVRYFELDLEHMRARFADGITLPLQPFQGTLGVAPPPGFFGATGGVVSSVPPGPHGGNIDLRELGEGSRLYLPVWQRGAKIFTGDSHALQGDGEVDLTALETAMQELRIQVLLHKNARFEWPFAETDSHWIALGMDKDLNAAFRIALLQAIEFLTKRAGLSQLDAYALCSVGTSFRITQVVDVNKGVHAMIPKAMFDPSRRAQITVV